MQTIWIPKLKIPNTELNEELKVDSKTQIRVLPEPNSEKSQDMCTAGDNRIGNLEYSRFYQTNFICNFQLTMFPFDTQYCNMKFNVINEKKGMVVLEKGNLTYSGAIDLSSMFLKNQFLITGYTMRNGIVNDKRSFVHVDFVLQRSLSNIVVTKFLPTLLLNVIGHAMKYLDKEYFETILTVNLTVMLVLATM